MNIEKTAGAQRESIFDFFEKDHREIDKILLEVRFGSLKERASAFEEFDRRLERHIVWEEDVLFPVLAARCPQMEHGPLPVMRMEHQGIRLGKKRALEALRSGDLETAARYERELLPLLSHHNMKEEQVIYPTCDEYLSVEEVKAVLQRLR